MPANKVLVNAMHLRGNYSGVHHYADHLISHLGNSGLKIDLAKPKERTAINGKYLPRIKRVWHEQFALRRNYRVGNYDLLHATNYVLPIFWRVPSVLTVHDTIALDFPKLCKNETVVYYGLLLKKSIKAARKVLVVSNQVKQDIIRHTGISPNNIKITYLGVDKSFSKVSGGDLKRVKKQYELPDKFFLFVGNLEPKKNLKRLIEAFHNVLPHISEGHTLVIAGEKGWKYQPIFDTINQLKIQSNVKLLGYVPQNDLPALYQLASAFVFPSLYEGFGLPVAEAMSCGTPVLISNRGSLPEITGGYARQVDPMSVESISKGLFDLMNESNELQIKAARERAKFFTWEKTASNTLATYEEILNSPAA